MTPSPMNVHSNCRVTSIPGGSLPAAAALAAYARSSR